VLEAARTGAGGRCRPAPTAPLSGPGRRRKPGWGELPDLHRLGGRGGEVVVRGGQDVHDVRRAEVVWDEPRASCSEGRRWEGSLPPEARDRLAGAYLGDSESGDHLVERYSAIGAAK
jgi:hypothetical protein